MADSILVSGTTKTIKSNTGGTQYIVRDNGLLIISSGGTLSRAEGDHFFYYEGEAIISSGGITYGGKFTDRGLCIVCAGGIASAPTIGSSSWIVVSSGGKSYNAKISSGGIMDVSSGGFAYSTFVYSSGEMRVYHYASDTFVSSGGIVRVGSGATLIHTTLFDKNILTVSSGGTPA